MEGDEEIEAEEEMDEEMDIIDDEEEEEENIFGDLPIFNNIEGKIELKTKGNPLYEKINIETLNLSNYLEESIKNFHKLFNNKKLKSFDDALDYLENISNQNKCVCAAIIDNIPAWRCVDCCKYESAIYCSECYKKSKNLHQNHKIYYLYSSGGMCDCGDPDSLSAFCPDHSGPFSDQDEINKYISNIFSDEIIHNLNTFFEEFFGKFSKFFILSEKFELFAEKKFDEFFNNINNINIDDGNNNEEIMTNKKTDIVLLKSNFCSLFQKLLNFFRLISIKNLGMLNILSNYFLKNNIKYDKKGKENEEEFYKTKHKCIKISENDIQIINYNNSKMEIENEKNINNNNLHECECCFLRLLLLNCRDNIKSQKKLNDEFILSFPKNFPLKRAFCILYFYDYNQFILNNNISLLHNKSQFFAEEITVLLAEKTNFIENSFETFYNYFYKEIKSPKAKNVLGLFNEKLIKDLYIQVNFKDDDIEYFSKPKIRELMGNKISIIKRIIDCICLMHNQNSFISIVPHPEFQNKGFCENICNFESKLLTIIQKLNILIKWENYDLAKDIFQYIINKIINQEKEGIKQLKENEFSFHLALYRCFGLILNYFCFYYAFHNKCNIIESMNFCRKNFFKSQKEINLFVDIILNDYYKLFGFISGGKNEFFNYYNYIIKYYLIYLYIKNIAQIDFTLLKYLFNLNENNFSLSNFYKKSNIENVYSSFEELFINNNNNNNKMNIEEDNSPNLNNNINNIIKQWKTLLELIIIFMKDDSSLYWCFLNEYEDIISSKTKNDLFANIRNNKNAMDDLDNILKEQIVHGMVGNGNLIDLEIIQKYVNEYLLTLFGEKKFKEKLDELSLNKTNKEKKLFYLKDSNLKYIDINYYICPEEKSNAQKYIMDFKKDIIKSYNNYYFNPSELTFNFYNNVYEKIVLNKDNLEVFIKIIEKILINSDSKELNSIKNIFLPIVLNYLSIFGCINSQSFIKFKNENKELINKIIQILSNSVENNQNNKLVDNELEEYIKEIINQLKRYEIIYNNIKQNNVQLKDYDYNTNNNEIFASLENKNANSLNNNNIQNNEEKKLKAKNIKDRLKNFIKAKTEKFMDKTNLNENILKKITDQNINNNKEEESMCFFCRNNIDLKSFNEPYGKAGFLIRDFFYYNSIKSSVKKELYKLNKNILDDNLYEQIMDEVIPEDKNKRILSCGHYFHSNCFRTNLLQHFNHLNCPLCLKKINILIPPLNNFKNKYSFLKSEKVSKIINKKAFTKFENINDSTLFNEIIINFINNYTSENIKTGKALTKKLYDSFIEEIFLNYRSNINFLENIFFIDGTHFIKHQQIDIIQNFILSIRFLVKTNILNIGLIIDDIKKILSSLIKGPRKQERILFNYETSYYNNNLEKLFLLLSILFNYNEIKDIIKYIINLFIPYFIFGFYLRNIVKKNKFYTIDKAQKSKINYKKLQEFLSKKNKYLIENFFYYFMQKILIIKIIIDFDNNNNEEILNNFNQLSLEKILNLIGLDKLYDLLNKKKKDEINIKNVLKDLPTLFQKEDLFYKQYGMNFNYKKIFESLINNIKNINNEKYIVNKNFILQFTPIKFNFINLDNNIFDFVEKNLYKKCIMCYKNSKFYYICLICGSKLCHSKYCRDYIDHLENCTGEYCIYLDMDDMQIFLCSQETEKNLYPLYVNEDGVGPSEREIGNEFNLSKENLNLTLKKFICHDFNFNH